MDAGERATLAYIQNLASEESEDLPPPVLSLNDVLDGSERLDISHAGGEFASLEEDLEREIRAEARPKYVFRTIAQMARINWGRCYLGDTTGAYAQTSLRGATSDFRRR